MIINKTEVIVKASILEDALLDDVTKMIQDNPRLFDGEKVVLMADAHRGANVPVGFTMTLSKGLVPVDYVSADMFCGVSSVLLKNIIPTKGQLFNLNRLARDLLPVNRRIDLNTGEFSDEGTLGNGNHFIEIGINGTDTLISVHSGSRGTGGAFFKEHKKIAEEHTKEHYKTERQEKLQQIEPHLRSEYLKSLPKTSSLPLLDITKYPFYFDDLEQARKVAFDNRRTLAAIVLYTLFTEKWIELDWSMIDCVHNYIDNSGPVPILRKGSISAKNGEQVIIPINMKDGIIVGTAKLTEDVNYSLPHGAGRVLSRTAAFNNLSLEDYRNLMVDVISPTVNEHTLDESPEVYKPIEAILQDITPFLSEYTIFKSIFNYKGVE